MKRYKVTTLGFMQIIALVAIGMGLYLAYLGTDRRAQDVLVGLLVILSIPMLPLVCFVGHSFLRSLLVKPAGSGRDPRRGDPHVTRPSILETVCNDVTGDTSDSSFLPCGPSFMAIDTSSRGPAQKRRTRSPWLTLSVIFSVGTLLWLFISSTTIISVHRVFKRATVPLEIELVEPPSGHSELKPGQNN